MRPVVLSTGEKTVAEKISEDGKQAQAGQLVRIIDIPADAGAGLGLFEDLHGYASAQAFADALKAAAATHYGHTACEFIKSLQERVCDEGYINKLKDRVSEIMAKLIPIGADSEVKRVAWHFAVTVLAGELANEYGIVNWPQDAPFEAAKKCFEAWIEQRGGTGSAEDTIILEKVKMLLITHGSSRFQDLDRPDATCNNRLGYRRHLEDDRTGTITTEYYMPPEIFKKEVSDKKSIPKLLYKNGLLLQGDGSNGRGYTRKPSKQLPGIGYKRCYVLVMSDEYKSTEADDPVEAQQILDKEVEITEHYRNLEHALDDIVLDD